MTAERGGRRRGRLVRSAALVAVLTGAGQLLGFLRDTVTAAVLGAGREVDAFLVAQGLMNLVLGLLAGAVAKGLVPPLARAVEAGDRSAVSRTTSTALTAVVVVLAVSATVMAVFAGGVVDLLAPGFDEPAREAAVDASRIVLLATVPVAATNVLAAAAQAHRHFFWAAVQGVPFNLAMVVAVVLLGDLGGARALALGFVAGSLLRLLVQLPAVRATRLRLRPQLRWRDPGFAEVRHLLPPLLLSSALVNVTVLVDRGVGSTLGVGSVASLNYAWRLVDLVVTLVVAAAATSVYPALAAAAVSPDRADLRTLVRRCSLALAVLLAPAAAGLLAGSGAAVDLVFGRGSFDGGDVDRTASAAAAFGPCLVLLGVREVLLRCALALGERRAVVHSSVVGLAVNVVGDLALAPVLGVRGIALATTCSVALSTAWLATALQRRHGTWSWAGSAAPLARVAGATAVGAGLASAAVAAAGAAPAPVAVAVAGGGALLGTWGTLALLRGPEVADVTRLVRGALARGRAEAKESSS